jgi:hypothetical protein
MCRASVPETMHFALPPSTPTSLPVSFNPSASVLALEEAGSLLFSSEGFSSSYRQLCKDFSVMGDMRIFLLFPERFGLAGAEA